MQSLAECCRYGRDPAAFFEQVEVVNNKPVTDFLLCLVDKVRYFVDICALGVLFACKVYQIAESRGIAAGVDQDDLTLGIFLHKFFCGYFAGVESTAESRGDTGVEDILARLKVGLKVIFEAVDVDLAGLGDRAVFDVTVELIELHHTAIGVMKIDIAVYFKLHRNYPDPDFFYKLFGEIA